MNRARTLLSLAGLLAVAFVIWFQREQNHRLVQELEIARQEQGKAVLSGIPSNCGQNETTINSEEDPQSELLRLRGVAARVARAESENAQLRRELAEVRASRATEPGSGEQDSDSLSEYLGSRVATPSNLDPRYTKEGLSAAIQLAAQNAGISLRQLSIDESEFPFLTGVVTQPGDWDKLTAQLKQMDGYAFHGSVGDETRHTLCAVPSGAYPLESAQNIHRRMNARLELFYSTLVP